MTPEQVAQALNDPTAQALLQSPDPARLAYLGPDASPRVIPVGFLWKDNRIVICTADTAPKVQALFARPEVALTIEASTPPARVLSVRGTAAVEVVDGVPDEYLQAAAKSADGQQLAEFEEQVRSTYDRMARISITALWVRVWDFGEGRLPAFLSELLADRH